MASGIRWALAGGLALAVLTGCASTAQERRVAQGADAAWTPCNPSPATFYLVCVKR